MFAFQEVEQADIETQESVIRVVSPTDVQFKLDDQDKEEVMKAPFHQLVQQSIKLIELKLNLAEKIQFNTCVLLPHL